MPTELRTWVEVSASALQHNLAQFQRLVGPKIGIMPIVKANAYGHGIGQVLQAIRSQARTGLGVAHGDEAIQLRQQGWRGKVVVLTSWQPSQLPLLLQNHIELVIGDSLSLRKILAFQAKTKRKLRVHLKLDTGTSRIGFLPSDLPRLTKYLGQLRIASVFSHFANAEEHQPLRTHLQTLRFTTLVNTLGLPDRVIRHIACTAAGIRYPEAYFGLVRLGIGLYGIWPSPEIQAWAKRNRPGFRLKPALRWHTRLVQVKTVPAGVGIGYGSTVVTKRPTRIGIIPVGYADGLDRRLSNRGWVLIGRQYVPIIGRICMNLTILDVSKVPVSAGQAVTLIGPGVGAEQMAEAAGTIEYEIVSRINPSIPRQLV